MCVMLVKDWHRRRSADSTAKRFKSVVFCLSNITSMKFRYGPREEEQKKNEMWAGLDTKETDGQILRTYNTAKLSKKTHAFTLGHTFSAQMLSCDMYSFNNLSRLHTGNKEGIISVYVCVRECVLGICPWGFWLLTRLVLKQCLSVCERKFVTSVHLYTITSYHDMIIVCHWGK